MLRLTISGTCPHPTRAGRHEVYVYGSRLVCRACGAKESADVEKTLKDWSEVQVGDVVGKGGGYFTLAQPVKVLRRTPKYLYLEDGERIHVEHGASGLTRNYEPWSDQEQAERAARIRHRDLLGRLGMLRVVSPTWDGTNLLTIDDVSRDDSLLADIEAAVAEFAAKRAAIIARAVAGRTS